MTLSRRTSARRVAFCVFVALAVPALGGTSLWSAATAAGARVLNLALGRPAYGGGGATMMTGPTVTATKVDALLVDADADGKADVGDTIRYTVAITASGADATGVHFADTPDPNTSRVGGSIVVSPTAFNETYQAVGNMTVSTAAIGSTCGDNVLHSVTCNDQLRGGSITGFGPTLGTANGTAPGGLAFITTSNGGTVVLDPIGTFGYNPSAGFEGADSFFYTIANAAGSDVGQVTINVGGANGMVWFVAPGGGGSGKQTSSISLSSLQAINNGVGTNPAAGDTIFLFEGAHTGPIKPEADWSGRDGFHRHARRAGAAARAGVSRDQPDGHQRDDHERRRGDHARPGQHAGGLVGWQLDDGDPRADRCCRRHGERARSRDQHERPGHQHRHQRRRDERDVPEHADVDGLYVGDVDRRADRRVPGQREWDRESREWPADRQLLPRVRRGRRQRDHRVRGHDSEFQPPPGEHLQQERRQRDVLGTHHRHGRGHHADVQQPRDVHVQRRREYQQRYEPGVHRKAGRDRHRHRQHQHAGDDDRHGARRGERDDRRERVDVSQHHRGHGRQRSGKRHHPEYDRVFRRTHGDRQRQHVTWRRQLRGHDPAHDRSRHFPDQYAKPVLHQPEHP
ncbi:MAG: hypothetical protein DMF86_25890 [Acidobacteria bacterium]|nr:MAG: hypothetical protein DMF86_25890 [Acidobacteriota bacterium]